MSGQSEVVFFKSDDPKVTAAAKNAQESFRWFWYQVASDFNRIVPSASFSMIKAAFCDDFNDPDASVEHMFVDSVFFDGETIHGILRSDPNWVQSVKDGDEVTLTLDRVGDWICEAADVVYGGFAVQVIRSQMSPDERASHDEAWGLDFPEIGVNHIPERSPKFESMINGHLKKALAKDPEILTTTDENLRTPLHNEALFGRLETTKTLLEHGADATAKCDRGWTPADYAKAVGFNEVAKLL